MMLDLPITLDRAGSESLVAQLATALRDAVHAGLLRSGEPVPSSRALATSLGLSRGTVTAAYDQLSGEGYLESRPGAATRVRTLPAPGTMPASAPVATRAADAAPVIDLTPGHPSSRGIADPAWRAAWREAAAADPGSSAPPAAGADELRRAIADHLRRARGLSCDPDDVIVTAGTSDALLLIGLALRGRSGEPLLAVENPGYRTGYRVLVATGARLLPIGITADGLSVDALEAADPAPDAVLVTPSHQYPCGGRLPVQQRLQLLAWAEASGAVIIEDDYDSEFRHDSLPLPALASLDRANSVVLVGTLSKVLSPGLRVGYLVARGEVREELLRLREVLGGPVAGTVQSMMARYLGSGALARHISRRRREYAHRRALVIEKLGALPGIRLGALDGGLHAVVHTPDAAAIVQRITERGVLVAELADYDLDGKAEGFVLGYGAVTDLELDRALGVIEAELLESESRSG
ncbi:PLP-dependent aminotransferase family protein [Diaminobutyricimonas sp. LJ205]|uniref:MocR-like pyridoxine biosynthesis transcription factor PdxR n=1 Tax=Diaminobutyricimonas sp. LJ205 TaxID=2683590 RepID=UPI001E3F2470|nr:PLP-dependent aminotransferase family protein [Diaminobutyricimonas sp. LJ205]